MTQAGLTLRRRQLFERLRDGRGAPSAVSTPILQRNPDEPIPLSYAQERFWFLEQLMPGNALFVETAASEITLYTINPILLERAINAVVARHEILRTAIRAIDGVPRQIVLPSLDISLAVVDLSERTADEQAGEIEWRVLELSARPFDLEHPPLLRATLFTLGPARAVFVLNIHHIVTDGWSMQLLSREINERYAAQLLGRPVDLPPLPIQYGDFACWQRSMADGLEDQIDYWRRRLQDMPELTLPLDHHRPQVLAHRGARLEIEVPPNIAAGIRVFSQREQVTPFMTMLAAFAVVLQFNCGQRDIAIGTPIAGRTRSELEQLIGVFLNTLVLRVDLSADLTFRQLVRQIKQTAIEAFDHQDAPFERVVEALAPERDLSRNPLFQVLFQFFVPPTQNGQPPQGHSIPRSVDRGAAILDLAFHLWESAGGIAGHVEYNVELFAKPTIERLIAEFVACLGRALVEPDVRLSEIDLLSETERRELLVDWQGCRVEERRHGTIHSRFAERATATPDATALIDGARSMRYADLEELSNRYANHFRACGLSRGGRVALCLDRSFDLVAVILAVLKAGAAFVPIDPAYPGERIALILADCAPDLVVASMACGARLKARRTLYIDDPELRATLEIASCKAPAVEVHPLDVAYVIYTSGSTGAPKGVMGLHRATLNRFEWMWRCYPFEASELACQKTAIGFVDAIWETLGPLLAGTPLQIIDDDTARDSAALLRHIAGSGVTRLLAVPSLLQALLDSAGATGTPLPRLRWWFVSGERLSQSLSDRFHREVPGGRLVNLYGSSEVAGDVTAAIVDQARSEADPPIGRPIDNCRTYVLDDCLNLVPPGVEGDLYVAGENLARGYLDRPGQTGAVFLPDPYDDEPGSRMYATGDRARLLRDGSLEFLGRRDQQVKVRGHRIELGEIESAIRSIPQVSEAVVMATPDGAGGRIDAWIVGRRPRIDVEAVRRRLASLLPAYMVPSTIASLEALPLTPNGKVDRLHLAKLAGSSQPATVAPEGPVQTALTDIWRELLGRDHIGASEDFFTIGGHSLLATRLVSRIYERFGVDLALSSVFLHPTIEGLAGLVEESLVRSIEGLSDAEAEQLLEEKAVAR